MTGEVLSIKELLYDRDSVANTISQYYDEWVTYRNTWVEEKKELRDYLFATDTRKTSNKKLPWKNSTTIPKLTQIRDNLHANYMAAMFPNEDWLDWEGDSEDDEIAQKKEAIENYMKTKLRQDNATIEFSKLLLDYIDYGNCFATAHWVDESETLPDGTIKRGFVGPRVLRISPYDIVFNPLASRFEKAPKIIRSVKGLGELVKVWNRLQEGEEKTKLGQAIARSREVRQYIRQNGVADSDKSQGFQIDGFSSMEHYFSTESVEILTFYGDMYNMDTGEFLENYVIQVIDRCWVLKQEPNPSWMAGDGIFHAGWRLRPDNLYAMGPLDNLVGLQYRIDHLENLKADAYDLTGFPIQKITGFVEDYTYQPGERINVGEEGNVEFMRSDLQPIVSADTQIQTYMMLMEELAGAPREAMGIRSPGEKTKFEVQKLDNATGRIFDHKTTQFSNDFFLKVMNFMLSLARQNMSASDVTRTLDSEVEAVVFSTITKDDITANGILRPVGASHFAKKANTLQNLVTLANTPLMQDPSINVHISGKKIARLVEELADLDEFKLYSENIRVTEQAETQRLINTAQERVQQAQLTPSGIPNNGL